MRVDFRVRNTDSAIVFIHGFLGHAERTWGTFPQFLMDNAELDEWDIFGVGYSSNLRFEIGHLWAGDASLELLGYYLRTVLSLPPLQDYHRLALIAHSMGGLIAQQALTDPATRSRVSHLFMFGTPSAGVGKANPFRGANQQARDMAVGSAFITSLRAAWPAVYDGGESLVLRVIAGERDAFVLPSSSIEPFPNQSRFVVPGDHSSMIRPTGTQSPAVQIVVQGLLQTPGRRGPAALPTGTVTLLLTEVENANSYWDLDRDAMSHAVERHDEIVRTAIESHRGVVFRRVDETFYAAFAHSHDAIEAAAAAQRRLAQEPFPNLGGFSVRMALHAGTPEQRHGEYHGKTLDEAQALLSAAHGGQTLLSSICFELGQTQLPVDVTTLDLGERVEGHAIYQLNIANLRDRFPPLRLAKSHPTNLPKSSTSFVGRETEIAEIASLLAEHRFVTLCGSGGIGKTRLALQLGAALIDNFRDGVWFVDLAPIRQPELVASALAEAMGVQQWPGHPLLEGIVLQLRSRSLLLIIDNCEQVVDEAARIADAIFKASPYINILATSRELLRIAGERAYRMPSLPAIPDIDTLTAADALQYGSVLLFSERAKTVDARFVLTDDNAKTVAHICKRLDGIALAIELAAARVKSVPLTTLAKKLDEHLLVLTGGLRTALPRQQTMRALIGWSYDLLDERERTVFARLSIFIGGFTLEAAAAVCADETIDELDIFEIVASLADKSLVQLDSSEGERCRLLDSTREFAGEQLEGIGGVEDTARRHAEFYRSYAIESERLSRDHFEAMEQRNYPEIQNFRIAIQTHLNVICNPALAVEILWPLRPTMANHILNFTEFTAAVDALSKQRGLSPGIEGRLRILSGFIAFRSDVQPALENARRAEALFEACKDSHAWAISIMAIAECSLAATGSTLFPGHEEAFVKALKIAKSANDRYVVTRLLLNRGISLEEAHRPQDAIASFAEIEDWADTSDVHIRAGALGNIGIIYLRAGDYQRSADMQRQAMELVKEKRPWTAAHCMDNLALAHLMDGNYTEARQAIREAFSIVGIYSARFLYASILDVFAILAAKTEKNETAIQLAAYAQAQFKNGLVRQPWDQELFDNTLAELHNRTESGTFEHLWKSGTMMTAEQAKLIADTV